MLFCGLMRFSTGRATLYKITEAEGARFGLSFMQYVLTELIDNGDFERHINRVRRGLRKQNK